MKKFSNTFGDILQNEKQQNQRLVRTIVEGFYADGLKISNRSIQMYINGSQIPPYKTAKEILKILKIKMSEEQLLSVLAFSENNKYLNMEKISNPDSLIKANSPYLKKRLSIKYSEFTFLENSDVDKKDAIELIENKVLEKYGNDKFAFNRYIRDLIDKDMNENQ